MPINKKTYVCIYCKKSIEIENLENIFFEDDENEIFSPDGQRSLTSNSIISCLCKKCKTEKNDYNYKSI